MSSYGSVSPTAICLRPGTTVKDLESALHVSNAVEVGELLIELWDAYVDIDPDDGTVYFIDVRGMVDNDRWTLAHDELPQLLAPLIEPGQVLYYTLDDERFRYVFTGTGVEIQSPTLAWLDIEGVKEEG